MMLYENLSVNEKGHLCLAGYDTVELAGEYGTPLMLMDEQRIRARCRTYVKAMGENLPEGSMPLFASKSFSCKRIYEIVREEGMGIDVVSAGELYTAATAGFPLERAYYHGNSKTDENIRFAMDKGMGCFVCDNTDELDAIDRIAGEKGIVQRLIFRLSPGIDPHTHAKISTGQVDSKFGVAIETGQAEELLVYALGKKNVEVAGFHCHIGSQILESEPFLEAAEQMLAFAGEMHKKHGFVTKLLNLGGGMGVRYVEGDVQVDYAGTIAAIGKVVREKCAVLGIPEPSVLMEPGRSIVADSGVTLYSVQSIKRITGYKNYVAINGGMTDNPRFTLYQSDYTFLPAGRMNDARDFTCSVAGCCCESGDLLSDRTLLPELRRGDLLAVLTTGAYNYSMASNYNRVPRPPIVMIGENGPYVAVRRESFEDLMKCDM